MTGLYLHIPFCHSKCGYCDFYSLTGDDASVAKYVASLRRELEQKAAHWQGPFDSVFFGGGTPSRLSSAQVTQLLDSVRNEYGLIADAEVTLEANPGTVSESSLDGYRAAGINRLSFGVQTFSDPQLKALGRAHSSAQAHAAFRAARRVGFDNLSCDLIFALPNQDGVALERDIETLLKLAPEHLSAYGLTLEEGTPLYQRHQQQALPLPDDEHYAELYLLLDRRLAAAGYRHYEISNYARPGYECRHNRDVWRRRPYLGVGAGAHSFYATNWGERRHIPPDLERYQTCIDKGCDPSQQLEFFDRQAAMSETAYLALRTAEGVICDDFLNRFGTPFDEVFRDAIRQCGEQLHHASGSWHFTPEGWLLYDHLIQPFLL